MMRGAVGGLVWFTCTTWARQWTPGGTPAALDIFDQKSEKVGLWPKSVLAGIPRGNEVSSSRASCTTVCHIDESIPIHRIPIPMTRSDYSELEQIEGGSANAVL
ncbi:hypothetical protein OG21DRAFT_1504830 [Imleria badia]|nr:hypothetical protein OG21DRAFT_1504830 [Imleria badia]